MADAPATKEQIQRAISDLEAQRPLLGDEVVGSAIAALREQLAKLLASSRAEIGDEERKIVTVMFADISGFTQLAEQMDAEAARGLVNACFERLVPVIQRYDGTIDKFLGDAIMAVFGAPIAHENDPERALRAALELMAALKSFNADRKLPLGLHIGINTGPVIAGTVGTQTRKDYSVMGNTVNVAARLEHACENNEIFVGPETFRQTEPLFEFVALEPLRLKGKSELLFVYRLIGFREVGNACVAQESVRTPLIGRDVELAHVKSAIDKLHSGEGSAVCIVGEAGLGKTRLISESRAFGGFAFWAETRALSYAETTSYGMARDLLHSLLGTNPHQSAAKTDDSLRESVSKVAADDFTRLYPYLARVLEIPLERQWLEQIEFLSAEVLQQRVFEAFQLYVERRAQREKTILVWEDVHWSDPSSLQLVERLASLVNAAPLLLIVAYRGETSIRERMGELMKRLPSERGRVIELAPLTQQASAGFIGAVGKIGNREMRQAILDRAEGNPLFLEELIRALTDQRIKTVHDSSDLPETLQAVLAARIDSLPRESKRVLQRASVIGRTFNRKILEHVCERQGENSIALKESLDELCRRNFIRAEETDRASLSPLLDEPYAFQHAITHEVAYQSLLQVTRRDWHRLTGEAMEALFPDRLDEFSGILGRHFEQAGVSRKAITYLVRAAEHAREIFSNLEAIAFYRSALMQAQQATTDSSLGDEPERDLIAQLHEGLGDVLKLNGEIEEARHHFDEAGAVIYETDHVGRSRLYRKCGSTWVIRRDYEKTFAFFRSAEEELEREKSDRSVTWWVEWVQLQLERMHLFYWLGMAKELNALALDVRPRLEKHGTSAQRGRFFNMLALSLLTEHHYAPPEIAVEYAERAVRAGADCDNPTELVHLRFPLGLIQLWRGNFDAAILELGRALQLSEKAGDLELQERCLIYLAVAHRRAGAKSSAQNYAERAISTATKLELTQYIAMGNATLAWVAWKDDDASRVETHAHQALEQWHSMPDPYGVDWMALWPLIAVEHEQKNFSAAIEHLRALFGPNQHPLPAPLVSAVERAVEAADNNSNSVDKFIADALTAARDVHQL